MLKLFTEHVKGEEMYGLTIHAVMRITESVRICSGKKFHLVSHLILSLSPSYIIEALYKPIFTHTMG